MKYYAPENASFRLPFQFHEEKPTPHSEISETSILQECTYFKEVIDSFKCPILTARILRLGVGAQIKPHRDFELGYEDGSFRIHIPIVTNPDVQFILDGTQLKMLAGECWYTNVNFVHSVKNAGKTDRLHLVIDGARNAWSDALFKAVGYDFSQEKEVVEEFSEHTLLRMIEELEFQGLPATKPLIAQYKDNLKKLQLDKAR